MLTEIPREDLISLGARHRAEYLVEQSGYTVGVAALDGPARQRTSSSLEMAATLGAGVKSKPGGWGRYLVDSQAIDR